MRPVEFNPESIIEAGQELQAAGRNITGFALRQRVGGGNPTRLKQVWDGHINSQTVTKAEPVAVLPVEVADELAAVTKALNERLANLAVKLNDKAVKGAERRVQEVVRAAGEQREQADRELADASQTVEDLEDKLETAASAAEVLEKRLADSLSSGQAQAVELAQLRERLAFTEQMAKATAEQHAELTSTLAKVQAERDGAGSETATAREDAAQLRGQVQALQTQVADQLRTLAALHATEKVADAKKP